PVNIPPEFRDRFQRVIFRVGTGEVERNPPNPSGLSSSRNSGSPMIANLDNRSSFDNRAPVSIDHPRTTELLPTSGNGGPLGQQNLGANPNLVNPNLMSPSPPSLNPSGLGYQGEKNSAFNTQDRFQPPNPANPASPNFDPTGRLVANTNPQNPSSYPPAGRSATNDIYPNSTGGYDNGNPKPPARSFDFIKPNGTSGYANNNINNGRTTQPPYLANNPNQQPMTPGYGDTSYLGGQSNLPPPNYQQSTYQPQPPPQNYNVPTIVNPNPYSQPSQTYVANNTQPNYRTPTSTNLNSNSPNAGYPPIEQTESNIAPRNGLIQFLLLFSIIGNVYLGCWMGYLRSRYRELLCDKRGIPLSELDS
ncbi:MAG: hypothetical protein ABL921_12415, partial [Pirellula sp.]